MLFSGSMFVTGSHGHSFCFGVDKNFSIILTWCWCPDLYYTQRFLKMRALKRCNNFQLCLCWETLDHGECVVHSSFKDASRHKCLFFFFLLYISYLLENIWDLARQLLSLSTAFISWQLGGSTQRSIVRVATISNDAIRHSRKKPLF